jgi:hypothetical protein
MDKQQKKQMRQQWRNQQRAAARDNSPLPATELRSLFSFLDVELPRQGCDHSRRLTERWLRDRNHDIHPVFNWLDSNSGFCDCEVLANCEQAFEEAMRGT